MYKLIVILVFFVVPISSQAQLTFNERYHLNYASAIFNGVYATDSCIYVSGVVSDTLAPNYPAGILWAKYSNYGELLEHTTYFKENQELLNFHTDLRPYQGGFLNGVEARKELKMSANLLYFDELGAVINHIEIDYFFPPHDNDFILPMRVAVGSEDKILLGTRERNPVGINNTETILQLFDHDGNMLWRKNFGQVHGNLRDYPVDMVNTNDRFVVGSVLSNTNKVSKNFIVRNYLFAVDTLGEVQWQYTSPSATLSALNTIFIEEDGSLIVSSFLGEEFEINASNSGIEWHTANIYKLQPPNEIIWSTTFEQPHPTIGGFNNFHKILKAPDESGYVIAGHIAQLDEEEGADVRGWLVKISTEGDSIWSRRLRYLDPNPQTDLHELYDLEVTPDGGYVMAGQVNWYNAPPPIQQGWLIKVDEWGCLVPGCHLLNTIEPIKDIRLSLSVFPNPATEVVNVLLKDEGIARRQNATLQLVDAGGQVLKRHTAGRLDEVTSVLPVYDLPAGAYWLQYVADGAILASEQFMKL